MNSTPEPAETADAAQVDATAGEFETAVTTGAVDAAESADAASVDAEEVDAEPDPQLLEAHDLALAALREITPEATIGDAAGYRVERDGVVSLRFSNRMPGYPGWFWTVSLARVEGEEPTVLEAELLPGDGALLAPDWVPWAERLAEYHATQAAIAEAAQADDDADTADLDDVDDLDAADFDDDGSRILHAGDVDGVDIDELAEDEDEDSEDESDDEFDDVDQDDDGDQDEDHEFDDESYLREI